MGSREQPSPGVADAGAGRADTAVVLALGTALAYGVLDQGAFYAGPFLNVLLLVAVALAARLLARSGRPPAHVVACAAAWWLLAGWALLGASRHGDIGSGWPVAAVAGCLAAAVWSAASAGVALRLLPVVVLALGTVVAATGWAGVALHLEPLALPSSGLWRAASTLTYANAAAALLVTALLVALAVLPAARRLRSGLVLTALGLGLAATMSRAGALALAVGLAVAAADPALRGRLARAWPVLPAAGIGFAGLLPSLPEGSDAAPAAAVAGLAGAVAVLVLADRRPVLTLALAAAGVAAAVLLVPPSTVTGIGSTRLTAASAERADLTRVTAAQFRSAPVTGVGAGRLDLAYVDHNGVPVLAQYTHDEYLQTAAETGVVGLGLALAGAAALAAGALRRTRHRPGATAALAVLAAFAVHSAFDFLWHVPVLPLLVVVAVTALTPTTTQPSLEDIPCRP